MKTSGVKLLATVAVLAMVVCAFAAIVPAGETDAADGTQIYGGETLTAKQDFTDVNVRVIEDLIVDGGELNINGGNFTIDEGVKVTLKNGGTININDSEATSGKAGLVTINGEIEVTGNGSAFNVAGTASGEFKDDGIIVNGKITATNNGAITATKDQKILINNGGNVEVKKNASISGIDVNVAVGGTFKFNGASTSGFTVSSYGTGTVVSTASIEISKTTDGAKASNLTFTTTSKNVTAYQTGVTGTTTVKQYMLNVDGTVNDGKITLKGNATSDGKTYFTSADAAKATKSYMYNDFVLGTVLIDGKLTVEDTAAIDVSPNTYVLLNGELNIKSPATKDGSGSVTATNSIQGTIEVVGKMTLDAEYVVEKTGNERGILAINGGAVNIDNNKAVDGKFAVYGAFWEDDNGITHITDLQTAITDSVAGGVTEVYICGLANSWYTGQNPDNGRGSYVIDSDLTIPDDTDVTVLCGVIVAEGATVTVSADASIEFKGKWSGMYVFGKLVDHDTGINNEQMKYEVKKTTETDTESIYTYTTLKIALSEAQPGETIDLNGKVTIKEDMTIPADVTVSADATETIGIDVKGATLTVNGVLDMNGTQFTLSPSDSNADVIGNIVVNNYIVDVNDSNYDVWPEGEDWSSYTYLDGAYFNGIVGDAETESNYIASVSIAAAASSTVTDSIRIFGNVNMGDVAFTAGEDATAGLTVFIYNTGNDSATAGTITLNNNVILNAYSGILSGNVTGAGAVITLDDSRDLKISVVPVGTEEEPASELRIESMPRETEPTGPATIDGTVTIASGTAYIAKDTAVKAENVVVASGATLVVNGTLTTETNPGFKLNSIVKQLPLISESLIENLGALAIDGTLTVGENGTLNAQIAVINGTLNVDAKASAATVKISVVNGDVVIADKKTLGYNLMVLNGSVSGAVEPVAYSNTVWGAIVAYPGSDVSNAKINYNGGEKSNAVSSVYYVNGAEYATVYATADMPVDFISLLMDVPGYDEGTAVYYNDAGMRQTLGNVEELKKAVEGLQTQDASKFKLQDVIDKLNQTYSVGDYPEIYIEMQPSDVTGSITVYSGMKLYIDGQSIENFKNDAGEYVLSVGEHKFSIQIDPGFSGTTNFTLDGQTVTGGTFTISQDAKSFQIVVTGEISQDATIVGGGDSDDGMSLTDILLIVLVVLILVMAIIVALRLMRS